MELIKNDWSFSIDDRCEVSHVTVAFGSFDQKRQWSSACEVFCLVHQCLLYCIISHQNNGPLPAQIQCHHRAIGFAKLEKQHQLLKNRKTHSLVYLQVQKRAKPRTKETFGLSDSPLIKTYFEKAFKRCIFIQLWQVSYERKCKGSWR